MGNEIPLISCLCVTRNKVDLLTRAINGFLDQTYVNKELIIVYEDNDPAIKRYLQSLYHPIIRVIEVASSPKMTLGELRNKSIDFADGEYICQWDADDWYHVERLETQFFHLKKMHKDVCFLTYWIMHDCLTEKAYLSRKRLWEGSMLAKKSLLIKKKISYPNLKKLEDFRFVESLLEDKCIYPLDIPNLYIYVYHGENTWDYEHFRSNFEVGQELDKQASTLICEILSGKYSNEESSKILNSAAVLEQLNYAYEFY